MALTTDQIFLLNNRMGSVARKVALGDQLAAAQGAEVGSSHYPKFGGTATTAGGAASENIPVVGVLPTDVVVVTVKTVGAVPRVLVAAAAGTDQIAVTFDADPDNDHVLQYVVFRANA